MQLHYESYGDEGYPLIILHGLFGSLENWRTLSRRFSRCYRVFAIDQRNHGGSPHSDVFSYQVMAEDLREFMLAHDLPAAYVLGHSMGGKTAMQFALTYPEMVDQLVVVDIAPKAYPARHDQILDVLHVLDLSAYTRRKDLDTALAPRIPDPALRGFLLKNVTRDAAGGFRWRVDLDAIGRHYDEIAAAVTAQRGFTKPALFIKGEQSDYIQDTDIDLIKTLFPQSRIVTVRGVGHWVHAQARPKFFRLVVESLGR